MTSRPSTVAAAVLAVVSTILIVWVVRLRQRVETAEYYAASGVTSVYMICKPVTDALRSEHVDEAVFVIAQGCIPAGGAGVVRDIVEKHAGSLAHRIDVALAQNQLPFTAIRPVRNTDLPEGLKE